MSLIEHSPERIAVDVDEDGFVGQARGAGNQKRPSRLVPGEVAYVREDLHRARATTGYDFVSLQRDEMQAERDAAREQLAGAAEDIHAVANILARATRLGEDDQRQAVKDLRRIATSLAAPGGQRDHE